MHIAPKRLFELLLILAALLEGAHLLALFERRAEVDGELMAAAFTAVLPLLPVLLGLAVTRRGSAVAKWVLLALIAIAAFTAFKIGTARWNETAILLGALALALQLAAALILVTTGGAWTRTPVLRRVLPRRGRRGERPPSDASAP